MKIAILGCHGMLAYDMIKLLKEDSRNELFLYDKHNCDLSHTHLPIKRIFIDSPPPDILINCSGYNSVDKAEDDRDNCYMVNSNSIESLSRACNKWGSKLVCFSSDYVFDGEKNKPYKEDDECNPLGVYGNSKLLGEQAASKSKNHIIIRTAWLFGKNGRNFVDIVMSKLKSGKSFKVVSDQFGSPTYTVDLARATMDLINSNFSGLINITNTNQGDVSWYNFSKMIAELKNMDSNLIIPCSTGEYETIAKRPKYSVLNCEKFLTNFNINSWVSGLSNYLGV